MDIIRVGLDFGTHQTKICVQRIPDEGHGEPVYEFFTFKDLEGKEQYVLPSLVQVNDDDTLSYGFVNAKREKDFCDRPKLVRIENHDPQLDIEEYADALYDKYATTDNTSDDICYLIKMLTIRDKKLHVENENRKKAAREEYEMKLKDYDSNCNLYRYFKQATFARREWNKIIDSLTLSIWYLAYVIFLLEEKYGTSFSINMGIPADDKLYTEKKRLAVEILLTAYNLVEEVYNNDMNSFLSETVEELKKKTKYIWYSDEKKYEYNINIFPEAYASLISLTSKGKLAAGMSLTADIGGGTTDISFFTISDGRPNLYRYWSIPRGLNFIAEQSGFDYADGDFVEKVNQEIIDEYNIDKKGIVSKLIQDLVGKLRKETNVAVTNLYAALKNRTLVYTGGGSIYPFLTETIIDFTDVKLINEKMWKEEHIINKTKVVPMCQILTTAYGLSIGESDEDVKLSDYVTLFDGLPRKMERSDNYVDKDMC